VSLTILAKGIKTKPPEEHRKTFEEFSHFVENGVLDVELLRIYKSMIIKADTLLGIFGAEKEKRGRFTYRKMPQANREPAKESAGNGEFFFKNVYMLINALEK